MNIKYSKMPRLLGLRLCEHDSNISYFDGYKVHYLKSERLYNIKWKCISSR